MGLVWFAVLLLLVAGLLWWMRRGGNPSHYRRVENVLDSEELALFVALSEAVEGQARVLCKVNLANVLSPSDKLGARKWQRAQDELTCWDLDYVLIDPEDGAPLCGIVLEEEEGHAEDFRRKACAAGGLALLAVPPASEYDIDHLRTQLHYYLEPELGLLEEDDEALPVADEHHHDRDFGSEPKLGAISLEGIDVGGRREPTLNPVLIDEVEVEGRSPEVKPVKKVHTQCPRCSSPLVERLARKGPQAGQYFMTCTRFPECRYAALTDKRVSH